MNEKIERYKAMRGELLQVDADLAEHKRAYLVDGVSCPLSVRVDLEARRAALRLQVHNLRPEIVALHEDAKTLKHRTFLHSLIELCHGAGLHKMVEDARHTSRQAIEAAGKGEAYRCSI